MRPHLRSANRRRAWRTPGTALLAVVLLTAACENEQSRIARAAAQAVARTPVLGPNDVQIVSSDETVALEVIGDSVHVAMANSSIWVPATHIENARYADGRLRFDIRGFGMRMFDVGDGTEGAMFRPQDALAFVAAVLAKQNELEARGAEARR
ncbi:MAG: hypothetical protein LCH84_08600 [Gemmatimonadetes bacterium]|nr:hypothetical protein [Gemmatimonadota bacterium]